MEWLIAALVVGYAVGAASVSVLVRPLVRRLAWRVYALERALQYGKRCVESLSAEGGGREVFEGLTKPYPLEEKL